MSGSDVGISLKFIRAYDPAKDKHPGNALEDQALMLALEDKRPIPIVQKVIEATEYLTLRRAHRDAVLRHETPQEPT
jgi:hypothetical protein